MPRRVLPPPEPPAENAVALSPHESFARLIDSMDHIEFIHGNGVLDAHGNVIPIGHASARPSAARLGSFRRTKARRS